MLYNKKYTKVWIVEYHDYDNGNSGPLILAYKKYPPLTTKLAMKVAENGDIEWYYPYDIKKVLPEDVHYNENLDGEYGWSYRHYVDGEPYWVHCYQVNVDDKFFKSAEETNEWWFGGRYSAR